MAVDMKDLRRTAGPESDVLDDEFLTVEEAAKLARVNGDTMRRWLRSGFVPGAKGGMTDSPPEYDRRPWRIPRRAFLERLSRAAEQRAS